MLSSATAPTAPNLPILPRSTYAGGIARHVGPRGDRRALGVVGQPRRPSPTRANVGDDVPAGFDPDAANPGSIHDWRWNGVGLVFRYLQPLASLSLNSKPASGKQCGAPDTLHLLHDMKCRAQAL